MSDERFAKEGEDRMRIVRKGDLDDAKADLRRDMKLYLLGGSAIGTALAGLLGAFSSGGAVAPAVETARAAASMLLGM